MSVALKKLEEIINDLPEESQAEIIDFAEYLREKERRKQAETKPKKKRVFGLHQGQGWISDDLTTNWATNSGSAKTLG